MKGKLVAVGDKYFTELFSLLGVETVEIGVPSAMEQLIDSILSDQAVAALVMQEDYIQQKSNWYHRLLANEVPFTVMPPVVLHPDEVVHNV